MKSVLFRLLAAATICAVLAGSLALGAAAVPQLRGDANGDGKLNARDVVAAALLIVGGGENAAELADYNNDGSLNARDVTLLMKYLTGWYVANDDLLELTYGVSEPTFEIADPVTSATVTGDEFGFDPNADDNSAAFSAAAAYLAAHPGTTLRLERAAYRMGDANVLFNGVKNCIVDGQGSTLLYDERNYFSLWMCEGVKFTGFTFKWAPDAEPVASIARVKSIKGRTAEFEFFAKDDASDELTNKWGTMFSIDPETTSPGLPGRGDYPDVDANIKERTLSAPNVVKAKFSVDLPFKEGEVYLFRHIQYEGTVFDVGRSSGLVFEDLTINAGPGVGFIVQDLSHHVRFTNVHIEPDPDEFAACPISTASDAINIRDTLGYFIIEDSSVGYCYDDCVNMRDNVGVVTYVDKNVIDMWTVNCTVFNVGDKVSFKNGSDFSTLDLTATITAQEVDKDRMNYTLTLDRNCEGKVEVGNIVCDDSTDTAHVIIRDSYFHHNRSRAMLIGTSDTVVERCRFERTQLQAISLNVEPTEGRGVDDFIIRNCVFKECNTKAVNSGASIGFATNNNFDKSRPIIGKCFENVLIAHNEFIDPCGLSVSAISSDNLTVYANTVEFTKAHNAYPERTLGRIKLNGTYLVDCRVLGNVWKSSPFTPDEANTVSYNAAKTTVEVAGNEIS